VCGIIGYSGISSAAPVLIEGLKKLEYRGYDSFGIATIGNGIEVFKKQGRISRGISGAVNLSGTTGIGHTRWATHGVPNDNNAHPHVDCTGSIAIVHNGIIENYHELRKDLIARGHRFLSETDTEVIVHLLEEQYRGDLLEAFHQVIPALRGSYALLAIAEGDERIVAARQSSPLVVGIGDQAIFAASDMTPLLQYTGNVVYLQDGDVATLAPGKLSIWNQGAPVSRKMEKIDWTVEQVKKGGFAHYMQKEIFEQPEVFSDTIRTLRREEIPPRILREKAITLVACGTSYHAGMVFKYLAEELCGIPVRIELASEFKYYPTPTHDLVIGITQSGETADTLAALKQARAYQSPTMAVTNVLGSTITRMADHTLYMGAGPEISVAATKSFIAELAVLLHLVDAMSRGEITKSLDGVNRAMEQVLLSSLDRAVDLCFDAGTVFFVGRGPFYAVALEGALKMKEISYIHAEGYAAGEIKHGPFALLSQKTPAVGICLPGETYSVMVSNLREMKARGVPLIVIGQEDDLDLEELADVFIPLPEGDTVQHIFSATVVLQLLAYNTAVRLDREIDTPRNLAKSVTVE